MWSWEKDEKEKPENKMKRMLWRIVDISSKLQNCEWCHDGIDEKVLLNRCRLI
jgi:hypothetical protein